MAIWRKERPNDVRNGYLTKKGIKVNYLLAER